PEMTQTTSAQGKACPIHFNHHSPQHAQQWVETYRHLREHNPRAWSDSFDGFWVATRLEDIVGVVQRTDAFSADKSFDPETGEPRGGVTIPAAPTRGIPNETDNPEWEGLRRFINRRFAP